MIVVTGASCPMGVALVADLLDSSREVLAVYNSHPEDLEALAGEYEGLECCRADLRSERGVRSVTDRVGPERSVTGIVHFAGLLDLGVIEEFSYARWREVFSVNVDSFVMLVHRLADRLARGASVVAICSTDAWFGSPASIAYAASKAALISTTKSLAVALGPRDVRVNALSPGHIAGGTSTLPVEDAARLRALRRRGTASDVARSALFLLGDSSEYLTGSHLVVDGGASVVEAVARNDWITVSGRDPLDDA